MSPKAKRPTAWLRLLSRRQYLSRMDRFQHGRSARTLGREPGKINRQSPPVPRGSTSSYWNNRLVLPTDVPEQAQTQIIVEQAGIWGRTPEKLRSLQVGDISLQEPASTLCRPLVSGSLDHTSRQGVFTFMATQSAPASGQKKHKFFVTTAGAPDHRRPR